MSEASKKFNIARSTLRDLVKADRKYTGRGRKSHVFTDEEEKIISERYWMVRPSDFIQIIFLFSEFWKEPTGVKIYPGSF